MAEVKALSSALFPVFEFFQVTLQMRTLELKPITGRTIFDPISTTLLTPTNQFQHLLFLLTGIPRALIYPDVN